MFSRSIKFGARIPAFGYVRVCSYVDTVSQSQSKQVDMFVVKSRHGKRNDEKAQFFSFKKKLFHGMECGKNLLHKCQFFMPKDC